MHCLASPRPPLLTQSSFFGKSLLALILNVNPAVKACMLETSTPRPVRVHHFDLSINISRIVIFHIVSLSCASSQLVVITFLRRNRLPISKRTRIGRIATPTYIYTGYQPNSSRRVDLSRLSCFWSFSFVCSNRFRWLTLAEHLLPPALVHRIPNLILHLAHS